ncbi:MAG: hypothetical protein RLZZ630_835 [Bacteroidota bacterium]|jgi:predicted  nucleic acid-binding Zn-ribbon protein
MATKKTTKKSEIVEAPPVKKPTPVVRSIDKGDNTIEDKLRALYQLQLIDSQIDRIRITRGELPMEVADLEDEVAGLQTRINNYAEEVKAIEDQIKNRKNTIKDAQTLIKKYQTQQGAVKNNREFDSLNKEIEYQQLEIQLCEKRTKEHSADLVEKKLILETSEKTLEGRKQDLQHKKDELDSIIAETEKEEAELTIESNKSSDIIEERLLTAYHSIRKNARNGLAVVSITRDACGGCFNKIPPQRQLDIRQRKKVIVCEHCGRILVDAAILERD